MSVATEKLTEVQDQVLDLVARIQEPVVSGIQTVATKVEGRLPEIKVPGLGDTVPTADELVAVRFDVPPEAARQPEAVRRRRPEGRQARAQALRRRPAAKPAPR